MAARVQIQIEAQDMTGGVLRAIASQFGAIGGAASDLMDVFKTSGNELSLYNELMAGGAVSTEEMAKATELANAAQARFAETLANLAINFLKSAFEETQKYGEEVRDLAMISGQGAEATSRFIQVLDDYQLSAQDAEVATRFLTKNGHAPTIETLAELSDKYLSINGAQERNQFILDNLGRGGMKWVNVLNQGSEALLANGAAINENLILSQKQLDAIEKNRLAMDNWNDSITGVKIELMTGLQPAMTILADKMQEQGAFMGILTFGFDDLFKAIKGGGETVDDTIPKVDSATNSYEAWARSVQQTDTELLALQETVNATDYSSLINSIMDAQSEVDRYNEKNTQIMASEAELMAQREELISQLQTLQNQGYAATSEEIQNVTNGINEVDAKLGENQEALAENEAAHKRWAAQTVFAFAQARAAADGEITEGEGQALIAMGVQLELFDEKTAEVMTAVNESFAEMDTEEPQSQIDELLAKLNLLTGKAWVIDIVTNDTGTITEPAIDTTVIGGNGKDQRQQGGEVYAGVPVTVGERGMEPFFPAVNGRILGNAEALHALSLGGGGGTNYFYGNVTLQISEETGGGLMSYR